MTIQTSTKYERSTKPHGGFKRVKLSRKPQETNRYLTSISCIQCYDHLFEHYLSINEYANKLATQTITAESLVATYLNMTHKENGHNDSTNAV